MKTQNTGERSDGREDNGSWMKLHLSQRTLRPVQDWKVEHPGPTSVPFFSAIPKEPQEMESRPSQTIICLLFPQGRGHCFS